MDGRCCGGHGRRRTVAFGDFENDFHIDMLFCRSDWGRRGVEAAIYAHIEARGNELALTRLFVEASEAARGPFERWGFRVTCRQDLIRIGVAIHIYQMEQRLG